MTYHIGFRRADLPAGTSLALLSGDPQRSEVIATDHLSRPQLLSQNRGLVSYVAELPNGVPVICATTGMGAPSTSIVVNELASLGLTTMIRIGTSGSIQPAVKTGHVVIGASALTDQGAANDIAPPAFPAAADPFLTVELARTAADAGVVHHVGTMASVDTFFEGQERVATSANRALLRRHVGTIDEYRSLGILNLEMEAGTLFKMGAVYGFATGCVCGIVADRQAAEEPDMVAKASAVDAAIAVAIGAACAWTTRRATPTSASPADVHLS